jgi:hypothetical protein
LHFASIIQSLGSAEIAVEMTDKHAMLRRNVNLSAISSNYSALCYITFSKFSTSEIVGRVRHVIFLNLRLSAATPINSTWQFDLRSVHERSSGGAYCRCLSLIYSKHNTVVMCTVWNNYGFTPTRVLGGVYNASIFLHYIDVVKC